MNAVGNDARELCVGGKHTNQLNTFVAQKNAVICWHCVGVDRYERCKEAGCW